MEVLELNHEAVLGLLPERDAAAHKGCFGRVLLLCGSLGYTGAAYLAAMGALRSGAGLVYLGVPASIYAIEAVKLNEAIVFPLPETQGCYAASSIDQIAARLPQMDAVLMGCGMGQGKEVAAVLNYVVENARCPLVLDADGLNLLDVNCLKKRKAPSILTPHLGEFRRLGGESPEDAIAFARAYHCIVLLKGHRSFITDGYTHYRNTTGNPGMAVGGSGDLLAGILTGLLGQKLPALEAAASAAWLHGKAGDLCAQSLGQYALLPSDLLTALPKLLK